MSIREYLLLYTLPIGVPLILIAGLLVIISWQLRAIRRAPRRAAADAETRRWEAGKRPRKPDPEPPGGWGDYPPPRVTVDTRDEERFHLGLLDEDAPTLISDNRIGKPRGGATIDDDDSWPAADAAAEHRE